MAKKPKSAPRGYRTATPYLIIKDAASAIDFYKQAFKAKVMLCLSEPTGKIGHAEIKIGDSRIMLADEYPEMGFRGPQSFGGSPVSILLYVDNCDDMFNRAVAKGAKIAKPMSDQFYGDRAETGGPVRTCLDDRNSQGGPDVRRNNETCGSRSKLKRPKPALFDFTFCGRGNLFSRIPLVHLSSKLRKTNPPLLAWTLPN